MMKRFVFLLGFVLVFISLNTLQSCSPKVGCEINEQMVPDVDRRGKLSTKGGDSHLFSKKMRKRMGQ